MYRKMTKGWLKHADFVALDILCLEVSFIFGYALRHGFFNLYLSSLYRGMAVAFFFIELLVFATFNTLHNVLKRGLYQELKQTGKHVVIVMLMASMYLFYAHAGDSFSRLAMAYTGILFFMLTYLVRSLWKAYLRHKMQNGDGNRLLIITVNRELHETIESVVNKNYQMYRFAGIVLLDTDRVGESCHGIPIIANQENLMEYLSHGWVDEVLFDIPEDYPLPLELIRNVSDMGITTHTRIACLQSLENEMGVKSIDKLGRYTVLTISMAEASAMDLFMKRCLDIVGGLIGCLITLLLTLIVGPMIKIASPDGPVFFHQTRIGRNGKKFEMYKFRSMYPDAEERKAALLKENRVKDGMMFKLDYDPRIIGCRKLPDGRIKKGIGNWIRDLSIDEFPQFFNVLKGDMSLVGTRPPTLDEWEKYEPYHRSRMSAKPGITGMWQVSGRSQITDFDEVVQLDRDYIENWSIGMDIKLLIKTVYVVLARKGAM
jgi:exopolysaccharide biosynthesis polyprenyl glycosylphosphotransferase